MKIILTQDVDHLGSLGDEVTVKPGYARNYLLPQGKALQITPSNKKLVEHNKAQLAKKRKMAIDDAKQIAEKLQAINLVFTMKAGDQGKLFGSVTNKQILDQLETQGVTIPKKAMASSVHLKTVGTHQIQVRLHTEVIVTLDVKVVLDQDSVKAAKAREAAELAEIEANKAAAAEGAEEEETAS